MTIQFGRTRSLALVLSCIAVPLSAEAQIDYVGRPLGDPASAFDAADEPAPPAEYAAQATPAAFDVRFSSETQLFVSHDFVSDTSGVSAAELLSLRLQDEWTVRAGGEYSINGLGGTESSAAQTSVRLAWSIPRTVTPPVGVDLAVEGSHQLAAIGDENEVHRGRARAIARLGVPLDPRLTFEARLTLATTFRSQVGYQGEGAIGMSYAVLPELVLVAEAAFGLDGGSSQSDPIGSTSGTLIAMIKPASDVRITLIAGVGSPVFNASTALSFTGGASASFTLR
jgi:hypothetical protein